jgi:polysaccharide export outer membrane protein
MRQLLLLVLASAAAALLGACAATGREPVEAINPNGVEIMKSAESQEPQPYRFFPGDELTVRAVNRPELATTARIDAYGYIDYPYLGQVYVKNLTSKELADRLAKGLEEGDWFKRPVLTVSFVGSKEQFVYVVGEVKKPGPIPINGSIPLLDAIGLAGGQTYDAEMSTVMWIRGRQSPPGVVKVNLAAFGDPRSENPAIPNFKLVAGDVIYIPDSGIVATQRFMNRMSDIVRPFVLLGTPFSIRNSDVNQTVIVNPAPSAPSAPSAP